MLESELRVSRPLLLFNYLQFSFVLFSFFLILCFQFLFLLFYVKTPTVRSEKLKANAGSKSTDQELWCVSHSCFIQRPCRNWHTQWAQVWILLSSSWCYFLFSIFFIELEEASKTSSWKLCLLCGAVTGRSVTIQCCKDTFSCVLVAQTLNVAQTIGAESSISASWERSTSVHSWSDQPEHTMAPGLKISCQPPQRQESSLLQRCS